MKEVMTGEDLVVLKNKVTEVVNSHYRIQAENDNIATIVSDVKELELMKPKMFRKLAKMVYNDSCRKENEELTDILDLAEGIGAYSHNEED